MNAKERGRRRFLKDGAALAGLVVGAVRSASGQTLGPETAEVRPKDLNLYGERSRFETSARLSDPKTYRYVQARSNPLQDSIGIITPSALHFMNNHGYDPPGH